MCATIAQLKIEDHLSALTSFDAKKSSNIEREKSSLAACQLVTTCANLVTIFISGLCEQYFSYWYFWFHILFGGGRLFAIRQREPLRPLFAVFGSFVQFWCIWKRSLFAFAIYSLRIHQQGQGMLNTAKDKLFTQEEKNYGFSSNNTCSLFYAALPYPKS